MGLGWREKPLGMAGKGQGMCGWHIGKVSTFCVPRPCYSLKCVFSFTHQMTYDLALSQLVKGTRIKLGSDPKVPRLLNTQLNLYTLVELLLEEPPPPPPHPAVWPITKSLNVSEPPFLRL